MMAAKIIILENDLQKMIDYIKSIPLDFNISAKEFGYPNATLICLDAVLSINRKYYSFVVPRIKLFSRNFPHITRLSDLSLLIDENKENFGPIWSYNHLNRINTLQDLVHKLLDYQELIGEADDLKMLKRWAYANDINDYVNFKVKGIGLATFQYLRMMSGFPTVKPDVHIKKAVHNAIGKKVNDLYAIRIIERASKALNLECTFVDHNIWRYFALKESDQPYLFS